MMQFKVFITSVITAATFGCFGQHGFVASDGINIYYQTFGEGNPIFIINGGPGFNSEGFEGMAKKIANLGYRTIIYDQRGTGKSKLEVLDSTTITMDLMVKAMVASSSGGLDLALLGNTGREILTRLNEADQDSLSYYRDMMRSGENVEEARKKHAQFLAPAYVVDKKHVPVVAERLTQGDMELNRLVWEDLRRIDYDTKEELKSFQKPVLIIQGDQDVVSKELAFTADSVFSNAELVFLDKSSHYGWLDQSEKYFTTIDEFLKKL